MADVPAPRLVNMRQGAAMLGCSFWTFRDYVLQGLIPTVELPALRPREGERPRTSLRRVLVDVRDIEAFIDRCKSGSIAGAAPSPLAAAEQTRTAGQRVEWHPGTLRAQVLK